MSTNDANAHGTSEGLRFSWPRTFLLGFGFLGVSIIWSLYNAYIPVLLKDRFGLSSTAIGSVMTIDNIFAIVLLPFLGALSDRTRTVLGRRRPYILVGSILAAVFFLLIPTALTSQILGVTMLVIILLNLSMALFRSPVIALMPDITPSRYRSQANGIINFMGGLGSLLVYFGGKPLYDTSLSLPFVVGGLVMLGACLLVVVFIREPAVAEPAAVGKAGTATASQPDGAKTLSFAASARELASNLKDVFTGERSLLFILLAIFFWFVGFNAIETFFTSYAKFQLGIKESTGALILGFFSVTFMVTSIASGFLGSRFGRRKTIRVGLVVVLAVMLSALFLRGMWQLAAAFVVGGFGWALVNVNSLPMVVDMTTLEKVGGYTGLYYFFSQAANIVAPPAAGALIDLLGYPSLMVFSAVMFAISAIIVSFVRRGDVKA
ncbi:MAG: SLC45 family MFS transporter [Spirochaetes bacterium]|nr:SLC45 family MFS transporter [Spirochaetota bacterium]